MPINAEALLKIINILINPASFLKTNKFSFKIKKQKLFSDFLLYIFAKIFVNFFLDTIKIKLKN